MHWRALAIFSQEGKKEQNLTRPRYDILINPIKFNQHLRHCTTQMANGIDLCNGTRFRSQWKISILFYSASPRLIEHWFSLYAKSCIIAGSTIRHLYTIVCYWSKYSHKVAPASPHTHTHNVTVLRFLFMPRPWKVLEALCFQVVRPSVSTP